MQRKLISEALAKVNGRVSYAAKLLGIGYQGLAYIIESRHRYTVGLGNSSHGFLSQVVASRLTTKHNNKTQYFH